MGGCWCVFSQQVRAVVVGPPAGWKCAWGFFSVTVWITGGLVGPKMQMIRQELELKASFIKKRIKNIKSIKTTDEYMDMNAG